MDKTLDWLVLLGRDPENGETQEYQEMEPFYNHTMELGGSIPQSKPAQRTFANGPFVLTGNAHIRVEYGCTRGKSTIFGRKRLYRYP